MSAAVCCLGLDQDRRIADDTADLANRIAAQLAVLRAQVERVELALEALGEDDLDRADLLLKDFPTSPAAPDPGPAIPAGSVKGFPGTRPLRPPKYYVKIK